MTLVAQATLLRPLAEYEALVGGGWRWRMRRLSPIRWTRR